MAGAVEPSLASAGGVAVRRQLSAAMAVALLALLMGMALWLVVRRASGAFSAPLGGVGIVAASVVILAATWVLWLLADFTKYLVLSTGYMAGAALIFLGLYARLS